MNLLEIYIKKIHSVEPYNAEWTREFPDKEFVEVDVTTDCYGNVRREQKGFQYARMGRDQEERILDGMISRRKGSDSLHTQRNRGAERVMSHRKEMITNDFYQSLQVSVMR